MDEALLKEIAEDIGELKGMVTAIQTDLAGGKKQFARHDIRIKRIEMWFLPVLAAMSLVAHKMLKWFGG